MAYKCREEVVGKRFLSVASTGYTKTKGRISEWTWRSGVIRAATHRDTSDQDLQVLVEFDDVEWHRRDWISVYREELFHVFLVEQALVWADRRDPFSPTHALWPALTFVSLVSNVEIPDHLKPIEFLLDHVLAFKDYKKLEPFQTWDPTISGVRDYPELRLAVKRWTELQDGQRILLTTPSVLVGYRVEVYRAEGTTQWYTAVIVGYNEATGDLTVTDDTVLEEHNEDAGLVQMRLIGDGVVESIMRGENVGITPRRSRSANLLHQHNSQLNRVIRGLSDIRRQRSGRTSASDAGSGPEPFEKGGKSRKRTATGDTTAAAAVPKEDLENKRAPRRRNHNNQRSNGTKKKVLEEANNSKLRKLVDVVVVVEDCLQEVAEDREKRDALPLRRVSMSGDRVKHPDSEDDCVIVAADRRTARPPIKAHRDRECPTRDGEGDDDGPLPSSSPYNRMDFGNNDTPALLRFPDDRSDSGVSSLRSGSGDERSGSRSSALSSSDEPNGGHTSTPTSSAQPATRSPLFVPNNSQQQQLPPGGEPVRVWRDPTLLLEEPQIRHIHSVQHQSLLMSHPSTPAASGAQPPTSAPGSHPASLYPAVPPPSSIMPPHHLGHNPHLPSHPMYPYPEMLWKQRFGMSAPLISQQSAHPTEELLAERERAALVLRTQELEKQHKEKERIEREKQEREREEKERQEQALHNHFEKSLRAAQQKREHWSPIGGRPPQQRAPSVASEDERKQEQHHHHQQQHQREQQRHNMVRAENTRDHRNYYASVQKPSNVQGKSEYPPPPAHSRLGSVKTTTTTEKIAAMHHGMSKGELNIYGYPVCAPQNPFFEPKNKQQEHHKQSPKERDLPNPPPLVNEMMKSSVIVKHDTKNNPHYLEPRVSSAHSPSPKARNEMLGHYMTSPGGGSQKPGMYEYRCPPQSPHQLAHAPSPHHHVEPQNLGKTTSHHRPSGQLPSPHHQRQSPHHQTPPHPSDMRYRAAETGQAMIFPTGKTSYNPFVSASSSPYTVSPILSVSNSKPKVSSPAPHHIYGKPSAGVVSVVPVSRTHEPTAPIHLSSKPPLSSSVSPSPYQQVSQYHPPSLAVSPSVMTCPPPPAHSSRTTSSLDRMYASVPGTDRIYTPGAVPGSLSVKLLNQPGTSPPTAASAPLPITSRSHLNVHQVQTQPLDLGVGSNKSETRPSSPKRKTGSPVCLEVKKRRMDVPSPQGYVGGPVPGPQLARVSEPSPLIASAATTITTVVNTAALRTSVSQSPVILTNNLPDLSVTAVTVMDTRPASTESSHSNKPGTPDVMAVVNLSSSPAPAPTPPTSVTPAPLTEDSPAKSTLTPSLIDSEKSNSPGPQKSSSSYPVRHLKKAWLQRHTGEDPEDNAGAVGSGSCVTLPLNINKTATSPSTASPIVKENPVNSIHSVGSMAVNSISKSKHFQSKSAVNRKLAKDPATVNGHPNDSSKGGDDSSSSDQERGGRKSPPKRKPPKVKRKKGGGGIVKKTNVEEKKRKIEKGAQSESGSDSEKESGSEKDSDSGASTTVSGGGGGSSGGVKKSNSSTSTGKEPRKRGRRPKGSKNDKGEESRAKKVKEEPPRDPFRKPSVGQLKKTGESFLQDGPCFEVAPKLAKCRECRWTPNQRSKNMPNIFCRFFAFRRLRYTKNGQLAIAGFSDPHKDALEDDIKLWLPNADSPPPDLDMDTSRFLLKQVGDHFCDLLIQEKDANTEHMSEEKTVAWKRVVMGVREMCDVCETTLFNCHWACGKCGFVVCLDCYKSRKVGTIKVWGEPGKDRDEFSWLLCTNRQAHEQEKLMLTQIIAGDSLSKLGKMVHEMRELWGIDQYCGCPLSKEQRCNNVACKEIVKTILADKMNGVKKEVKDETDANRINGVKDEKTSPLSWLADVALSNSDDKKQDGSSSEEEGNFSTLRELLIRPSHKQNGSSRAASPVTKSEKKKSTIKVENLDDVISNVIEESVPIKVEKDDEKIELKHFVRRYVWQNRGRQQLPIRIMTLTESKTLYPDVPHSWLCDGKLLRLSDPACKDNYKIFQDQWKRGQPVIVSDVTRAIDKDLWNPEAFARDFGDEKNDLINCMTGNLVPNQPMRKFWEGFDHFSKRLKDERGQPMLLKLKDWPPGEDFAEMLPSRYTDLMKVLPLAEYTHRTGRLNLASRLPDCFVRPDLGPKMYNAYGSALHPNKGTTNLHLDISDAVNVMVYVGIPKDGDGDEHIKEAFRAIDEAGCDILTRRRVRDKGELPGALWHIYNARDADKIRDLLNKVVVEKGGRLEPHHDPIHDQSCYLDGALRERLYKEYGVEGYAIVQCLGDAVFIPAGAPHQVRNLHNCIKVAEDFVSPENVSHCFHLTQEFRDLSDTHSNHEDKLQIKNIIYHAVKDSLSTLSAIMNRHMKVEKDGETAVTDVEKKEESA